jgi:hypothetical protein
MNILDALKKEHSKAQCNKIVTYIGNSPVRYAELVNIFLKGPYRITQRAAWPLSVCIEYHPQLIKPHLKHILKNLKNAHVHDAVKRNTVRLLQYVDIPKSLQGLVVAECFDLFLNRREPIAVRVFAMDVLGRIAKGHPDLGNELKLQIEDDLPMSSPAFRSRAKKVLAMLMPEA